MFLTQSPVPAGINPLQPGVRVSEDGLHHVRRGVPHSGHQCCDQQGRAPAVSIQNSAGIQSLYDRARGFHSQLDTDRSWFGIWGLPF